MDKPLSVLTGLDDAAVRETLALAMLAGARAIEQRYKNRGTNYVYDVFGAYRSINYHEAARLLRAVGETLMEEKCHG